MVRDQATNSVAGAAVVTEREKAAQIGVKAGGSNWSLGAWFRWAKNRMTGRSDKSAGVGGEVRW